MLLFGSNHRIRSCVYAEKRFVVALSHLNGLFRWFFFFFLSTNSIYSWSFIQCTRCVTCFNIFFDRLISPSFRICVMDIQNGIHGLLSKSGYIHERRCSISHRFSMSCFLFCAQPCYAVCIFCVVHWIFHANTTNVFVCVGEWLNFDLFARHRCCVTYFL